jgi:hypothetical protein
VGWHDQNSGKPRQVRKAAYFGRAFSLLLSPMFDSGKTKESKKVKRHKDI